MLKRKRNKKFSKLKDLRNDNNSKKNKLYKRLRIHEIKNPVRSALDHFLKEYPDVTIDHIRAPRLLLSISLNYIRHEYTNYDMLLAKYNVSKYNLTIGNYEESFKEYVNKRILKKYKNELYITNATFFQIFI